MCSRYIVRVYRGMDMGKYNDDFFIDFEDISSEGQERRREYRSNEYRRRATDGRMTLTGTSRVIPIAVRRIRAERVDPPADMTIAATITDSEKTTVPVITGTGSITAAVTSGVGMTTADMTGSGTLTARNDRSLDPIRDIVIGLPKTEDGKSRICSAWRSSRSRCCW